MSVINTNITSMIGQQNLSKSQNDLTTSMERLSSGLRINSAKDDAAGQAIANRFSSQITGLGQAQRNANDGISIAQTAEGGLNQVNDNLQRVRELTVQSQNGTNSQSDLESIQNEINQRMAEIDRISKETDFNGTRVLAEDNDLKIQVGADDGQTISVGLQQITSQTLGLDGFNVDGSGETQNRGATVTDLDAQLGVSGTGNERTVTESFDKVELDRMLSELNTGDTVSITGGNDYTFNADSGDFSFTETATTAGEYTEIANQHTPPTGGTNTGSFEYSNGAVANFEVDASGKLSIGGSAAYLSDNGELNTNNPDGDKTQATLDDLLTQAGAADTGNMSVKIDGATYSSQASTANLDISSLDLTAGAVTSTGSGATLSNFTFAGGAGATANDLATALAGSDEIDSATVNDNGTIDITFAAGQDSLIFELSDSQGSPVTAGFTAAAQAGITYTDTATAAEVEAANTSAAATITTNNGITSASIDFAAGGDLADSGAQIYVDKDNELSTTASVTTDYKINQETGEVTVASSDGEGKYAVEEGATAYISSEGRLTTEETSAGERTTDPLAALDAALAQVDGLRSDLGAIQNRFESAITNLQTNETNLSAARSRIEDADYATEVANMTRAQILQQAGTSVLAQANQIPQNVLSLLG